MTTSIPLPLPVTTQVSIDAVERAIAAEFEPIQEVDLVLAELKTREGKRLDRYTLRAVEAVLAPIYSEKALFVCYEQVASMVHLAWGETNSTFPRVPQKRETVDVNGKTFYVRQPKEFRLLMAYGSSRGRGHIQSANEVINSAFVEDRNARYFAAAKERNAGRRALLENRAKLLELSQSITGYLAARERLQEALNMDGMGSDRYAMSKAFDLKFDP